LTRGIAAAKAKEKDEARFYLNGCCAAKTRTESGVNALLWLSQISDDPAEKHACLENILVIEPAIRWPGAAWRSSRGSSDRRM